MHDMKQFLQLVKKAAIEAYESRKPCDVAVGTVASLSPIKISLGNANILSESFFIFTGDIKQSLNIGDKLALVMKQGGQKFLVIGVID